MELTGGLNVSPVAAVLVALVAAGLDVTTIIALIAGISGAVTGVGAILVQQREVRTKADTSYVESNLRAMQALVDATVANEGRLQARCDQAEQERNELRDDLATCERKYDECLRKVRRLGRPS